MSTIPSGLTGKNMRERMQDKATITATGGMYVGGTIEEVYVDNSSGSGMIIGVNTEQLIPGTSGLLLLSNGSGVVFDKLGTDGLRDSSVDYEKLGAGTVVSPFNTNKKYFGVNGTSIYNGDVEFFFSSWDSTTFN